MRLFMMLVGKMPSTERPRIVGLTASPLLSVPSTGLVGALQELERNMCGARLTTVPIANASPVQERHVHVEQRKVTPQDTEQVRLHACACLVIIVCLLFVIGSQRTVNNARQHFLFLGKPVDKRVRQTLTRCIHLAHNVSATAARRFLLRNIREDDLQGASALLAGACPYDDLIGRELDDAGHVVDVPPCEKLLELRKLVQERLVHGKVLVFVEQREVAEAVALDLRQSCDVKVEWVTGHASWPIVARDVKLQVRATFLLQAWAAWWW